MDVRGIEEAAGAVLLITFIVGGIVAVGLLEIGAFVSRHIHILWR